MREHLEHSNAPVGIQKLQKELRASHGWRPEELKGIIAEGISHGLIFEWPAYRRSARYWHCDDKRYVRDRIIEIASKAALPKRDLALRAAKAAHNYGAKKAEAQIQHLVKEGAVKKTQALVGGGSLFYESGSPWALLETSARTLVEKFRQLGVEESDVAKVFAPTPTIATPMQPTAAKPELSQSIYEALQQMERGPVTVYRLRAAVPQASKKDFDQAVLALAEQQRVYLSRHDHGWALPEDERERLVHDGGTNLYVAVTLRD